MIATLTLDSLRDRFHAGESCGALDYAKSLRPFFSGLVCMLRDENPNIRPTWRTIREAHVSGTRLRERVYGISPRRMVARIEQAAV